MFSLGINDLPSIQHISSSSIVDIHAIDSLENSLNIENQDKQNGFLVLSNDGKIYRIKFQSILTEDNTNEQFNSIIPCFPQYVILYLYINKVSFFFENFIREQSKDTSKIIRMIFFNCNPSNLVRKNSLFLKI